MAQLVIQMRQALVFRAHGAVQPVNIFDIVSALSSGGEVLIFADSRPAQPEYRDNQSADRTFSVDAVGSPAQSPG